MSVFGVWMWPQSISKLGAERTVQLCAMIGVTDIFFLTKGLSGVVSYHGDIAPKEERDLLSGLLDAAHMRSIRVHAWLTSASDEHYKVLHPESGRCHYTRGRDRGLISLTDEGYLSYMEKIVRELCLNYAIDGLHLDYIRYNHLLYGWDDSDQARYAAAGADVAHLRQLMDKTFLSEENKDADCIFNALRAGDQSVAALANARRNDVRHFAQRLTSCARAARKDLILSAALMPEGAYADTAFSDLHYGQNYDDAAKLYDMVLPMAYSKAYEKDASWVCSVAEGTLQKGIKTVMGLHAYEGGTGSSLQADIRSLAHSGVDGVCLFRFGAFAIAIADSASLCVINTLNQPLTSIISDSGTELLPHGTTIEPGNEMVFPLASPISGLRALCGEAEICIYLADKTAYRA